MRQQGSATASAVRLSAIADTAQISNPHTANALPTQPGDVQP